MKKIQWLIWLFGVLLLSVIAVVMIHYWVYRNRAIPHTFISDIEVTGMRRDKIRQKIVNEFKNNPNKIVFRYNGKEITGSSSLHVLYNFDWTSDLIMSIGRNGNLLTQLKERFFSLITPSKLNLAISYDGDELLGVIAQIDEQIRREFVPARIIKKKGVIKFEKGVDGLTVNKDELIRLLISAVKRSGKQVIDIPVNKKIVSFDEKRVVKALELGNKWIGKTMKLEYGDFKMELPDEDVVGLIGVTDNSKLNKIAFDELCLLLDGKIKREPRDAIFKFENGKVIEFRSDAKGVDLNKKKFEEILSKALTENIGSKIIIPVKLTNPEIKADQLNNLGINELLGRGKSKFSHSIPSRIFNVILASKRINYSLVPPGEIFSFNKAVGEISARTGYRSAYVIKDGRTVLGDGGGTCQVSTTMFRAAMKAGLPIVERKSHSYRVGYYEQDSGPGIDATVYAPTADLKFLNDTPAHILIQTKVDSKNLTMQIDIFGTNDGRVAKISKPKVWGQSPPPPPLYQDDPTLPVGVVKQIDWASWGAKTSFNYKVDRKGKVLIDRTFYSNFKPWQAVYLRGIN